jgi:UDP-N-acetylmuramyl pentapeptide phosphotransferase/UDP-N-acetylglucosamine-1-phosphate transferase
MNAQFQDMGYAYLVPPLVALAVTWIAQRLLLDSTLAKHTLDYPNHRSLHRQPTPRTGGIAVALGIGAGWMLLPATPLLPVLGFAALTLALISIVDDLRGLSAGIRLAAHFAVCLVFLAAFGIDWDWILLLVVPMVWGVNLYNFMDGLDGLAGGMAVLGFGAYALLAGLHGNVVVATLSLCVSAAALGFLPFNFTPAKVFLGDVGSIPLGFLAAAIGVAGWHGGLWRPWFPVLVFSPFVVDATLTLAQRAARGVRLAEAHSEHYYQRLARLGIGHRNTALLEYALILLAAVAAVAVEVGAGPVPALALTGLAVLQVSYLIAVDRAWRRNRMETGQFQQQGPRV